MDIHEAFLFMILKSLLQFQKFIIFNFLLI